MRFETWDEASAGGPVRAEVGLTIRGGFAGGEERGERGRMRVRKGIGESGRAGEED